MLAITYRRLWINIADEIVLASLYRKMEEVFGGKIMARRSLQLRPDWIDATKTALKNSKYKTQIRLAIEAEIQAQSTVSNFFRGKPVERSNFHRCCELLYLDPSEVGEQPPQSSLEENRSTATIDSYICRSDEQFWYQKLLQPHALIKLQAPSKFGKTSLMWRMLDRVEREGYLTLYLNLNAIKSSSLNDFRTFLGDLIREVEGEMDEAYLDRLMSLDRYEELVEKYGHTKACLKYFEHLQKNIARPFVLAINKLDRLLDYPQIASEFFTLLRSMNENSKRPGNWQNFRLILAHSTPKIEKLIPIDPNQSPFNVGYSIEIPEFSISEIAELATNKGLTLTESDLAQIGRSIGGIPYLIQLTLDCLQAQGTVLLSRLVEISTAIDPIYQEHLAELSLWLRQKELDSVMQQVATNPTVTTELPLKQQCFLHRPGLVKFSNNRIQARCELYRRYFRLPA